jgi:DNA helicase-2/ATP-dependent DNA helicase PcrA
MNSDQKFQEELEKLNSNQKLAVETINGPLCVLANAGSGKSTVVALRCCNILQKTDMQPYNILCLTFSNAGVVSMQKKLKGLIGRLSEEIKITTFHAFALDIQYKHYSNHDRQERSLITPGQRFMILEKLLFDKKVAGAYYDDKPVSAKKLQSLSEIFNVIKKEFISPQDIVKYANKCLTDILPFEEKYTLKKGGLNAEGKKLAKKIDNFGDAIGTLFEAYQQILDEKGMYEYQDMLNEAVYVLKKNKDLRQQLQETYQYIMVDEFQDCNTIMVSLLDLLVLGVESPNLAIVGDELQTIYRFQGANLKNFEWVSNMLPDIKTIVLDINYRSTANILNKSFNLIIQSAHIHPKKRTPMIAGNTDLDNWQQFSPALHSFEDQDQEGYHVANSINTLLPNTVGEQQLVVLARRRDDLKPVQKWLKHFGINYDLNTSYGNILETKYGKANAYSIFCIKFLDLDNEVADAYFCNLLIVCGYKNDIGYAYLLYKKSNPAAGFIHWVSALTEDDRLEGFSQFARTILNFAESKDKTVDHRLITSLEQFIRQITKEVSLAILRDPWQAFVETFTKTDKHASLESLADLLQYYYHMGLSIDYVNERKKNAKVLLSTIHGTKGLEYDHVFLISLVNSAYEDKGGVNGSINVPKILNRYIITEAEDDEDLRRLIYVAMTRAKKNLTMSYFRLSATGKALSLTKLLQPQVDTNSLQVTIQNKFEVPNIIGNKNKQELDEDFMSLIKDVLSGFHISNSSIGNWENCQNKFFYHNLCKIPGLPSAATSFGLLVHAVLHTISESENLQPALVELSSLVDKIFIKYQYQFHPLHRNTYKRYAIEIIQNYLGTYPILKRPILTEKYFTASLPNGVKLNGIIDRVDAASGGVEIIDYKTNKYAQTLTPFVDPSETGSSYWKQGIIYNKLAASNFMKFKNQALAFHYIGLNKIATLEADSNPDFESWLAEIWEDIQSLQFNVSCVNNECLYCQS